MTIGVRFGAALSASALAPAKLLAAVAATAPAGKGAEETGKLIKTTGARVETGFWDAVNGLLLRIPALIGFVVLVGLGWLAGRLLAYAIARRFARKGRKDLGRLLGVLATWLTVLVSGLLALTLLFPSINPTEVVSLLGIGSIALGFVFKDILQNLAAGIILLFREPYKSGDEIVVGAHEYEGLVEEVETRATHIRTIDGRLVIIPNTAVFNNAVTVNTDRDFRKSRYVLSVAYGGDPRQAIAVVLDAVRSADGVRTEPEPRVAIQALNDYSIDLVLLYAAGATEPEQIITRGAVLLAVHDACRAHGIALPFPTQVSLLQPLQSLEESPDKLDGIPGATEV